MKIKQVELGMDVVVNSENDATIYKVAEIDGFTVKLEYPLLSGNMVSGGYCDCSLIAKPNQKQINFSRK